MDTKEQNSRNWGDLFAYFATSCGHFAYQFAHIAKYRDEGRLNYVRISPRIIRYYPEEVAALIRKSHCSTWLKDNCARLLKLNKT